MVMLGPAVAERRRLRWARSVVLHAGQEEREDAGDSSEWANSKEMVRAVTAQAGQALANADSAVVIAAPADAEQHLLPPRPDLRILC